jgi:glycosidase
MQPLHLSRVPDYREPFGAVAAGTRIRLALRNENGPLDARRVSLCYAYGLKQFVESRIRLQPGLGAGSAADDGMAGHCWLRLPALPCLVFYWFEIDDDNSLPFYVADRDSLSGGGRLSQHRPRFLPGEPHSPAAWQITVYESDFNVPDWLPGSVIYQIFPDRFHRDRAFSKARFEKNNWPERIWHENWLEDVDFHGKPETGYLACDFFGGSLSGICEKLDYLAGMGVQIISLNPIFKARSNHRYDTGDYEMIDPLLGTADDFSNLCRQAAARGIRIILDGVFSHTGADSRYFNKFSRYPDIGAWQEATGQALSPYGSWYVFHRKGDQLYYDSWWGFPDLPAVNENDLSYLDYITGPDGIIRHWLRLGASGWRLDVSDELPDYFLRSLRLAAQVEKPDAIFLGEVWEDASNKISYGSYRDFLLGRTHDIVMGYPFQNALIGFLAGQFPAERLHHLLEQLRENYPLSSFYSSYNLISGHDIPRAITALAGVPDPGSREMQARTALSEDQRQRGEQLLRLAVLFQMTWPGCPVIYYGDETAMEGYRDPFNRRTFPWGHENKSMQRWFARLGLLRQSQAVLRTGQLQILAAAGDVIVFQRSLNAGYDVFGQAMSGPGNALIAVNRSAEPREISLFERNIRLPGYGWLFELDGRAINLK